MYENEQFVRDLLSAGARGYVLKSDVATQLLTAVETVARHKPFFTSDVAETVLEGFLKLGEMVEEAGPPGILTAREREIVQLLAESKSNKEVSATLGISVKTVQTHRATIMRKLGINSIVELVHYAIRNHLVSP
jgi:DNA-binding NarL/FixJ family response regulator